MKILLTTLNSKYIHMNLAVRLLFGLNREYDGLEWKEFVIKDNPEKIANFCLAYDVICFSCYIWNITYTLKIAGIIKQCNPNIKILLGGPEVSFDWQDLILKDEIDYIIPGEGEIPFKNFLQNYPLLDRVKNIIFKENGQIKYFPTNETFDLNTLRNFNPYFFENSSELKSKVCYLETSRGCPYQCEFCLASLDNKVRFLPIAVIKEHLFFLMEHARVIKFLDRTFNVKKDFAIEIFQFILDNRRPGNIFQFEITADIIHPDIVKFIHEKVPKGLFRFEIGIQTVNQKANLEINRKQNFEKTKAVILDLKDKIEMHLDLIVGLPLDYLYDIKDSFEQVFNIHPPELQLGFLKFLKGTPVREKFEKYGFVFDQNPPYQIIESHYLSKLELTQIGQLEEALELYWNKKRAVNTLIYAEKAFGIYHFLAGLGNWFESHSNFHKHTLDESFEHLSNYCKDKYPEDKIIQEFIAIDYYLHFKMKPKIKFLQELDKKLQTESLKQLKLDGKKFRFVALSLSFDYQSFVKSNKLVTKPNILFIQYNGVDKAIEAGQIPIHRNLI